MNIVNVRYLFLVYSMLFILKLSAQELDPALVRGRPKSEIEKKSVEVLQDRYFKKQYRPELGISLGSLLDEPYINSRTFGGRVGFFFSEWFGIEGQYLSTNISESDELKALKSTYVVYNRDCSETQPIASCDKEIPEINRIDSMMDLNMVFAPFYGKISLKDFMTLYSDTYFTAGYSKLDTEQGDKGGILIGAGQRFYMFKSLSFRIDFRDRVFTEKRNNKDTTKHAWQVDFGISYFFLGD